MMSMSQVWAVIGLMGTAFAAMIGLTWRSMGLHAAALTAKIDGLRNEMIARFEKVDLRFENVDRQFENVDRQFEAVDRRFGEVDRRLEGIEVRLTKVESKLDPLDREVHALTLKVFGNRPPPEEP